MEAGPPRSFPELLAAYRRDPLALVGRIPGLWLVNKPSGPSSHDMVLRARERLGIKRVGHAGTLDPMASGLLIILAGEAARLFDQLQELPKTYLAGFRLGERTDSQDGTGTPIPDWRPARPPPVAEEEFATALDRFQGEILQTPPMHSALKRRGRPLYRLARQGKTVARTPRPVRIYHRRLAAFDGCSGSLELTVSRGFYVRTLIDDLGEVLGCGATMASLVRLGIGPFRLENAADPERAFGAPDRS
ncbi:MAG: tRNA pseudouridine(55) synthase TruB [Planctomycetota bacterium]|jgi:tRNA pseudouridine55 synthase|nr:tRNA pseudouridine(55) synthase TruB [Planctomycetota bacterium]